jgi:hypothetical protein
MAQIDNRYACDDRDEEELAVGFLTRLVQELIDAIASALALPFVFAFLARKSRSVSAYAIIPSEALIPRGPRLTN